MTKHTLTTETAVRVDQLVVNPDGNWRSGHRRVLLSLVVTSMCVIGGEAPLAAQAANREDLKDLVRQLSSADSFHRERAAEALRLLAEQALPALPALIKTLRDPDDQVCVTAVRAVAAIGPKAATAIPALLAMMDTRPALDVAAGIYCSTLPAEPYVVNAFGRDALPYGNVLNFL